MANTIPGGAYLDPDKRTWRDANGRVIPAPKDPDHLYESREPEIAPLTAGDITPGADLLLPGEEYEKPEEEVSEGQPARARRVTKKS